MNVSDITSNPYPSPTKYLGGASTTTGTVTQSYTATSSVELTIITTTQNALVINGLPIATANFSSTGSLTIAVGSGQTITVSQTSPGSSALVYVILFVKEIK